MDIRKKTKFIVHGFLDSSQAPWMDEMKKKLLQVEDVNVIVVDWSGGNRPPYLQASVNTKRVGEELADLINYLVKKYKLEAKYVHIIGHSLGAHIAGYAGSKVHGLGRITGLDPAGPNFHFNPPSDRLDPSDAKLVDVIHTNGKLLGYGTTKSFGHLDFYPNGGKVQPGCNIARVPWMPITLISEGLDETLRVLMACDHNRAINLFIDTINGHFPYTGRKCSSFEHLMKGKCFDCKNEMSCALMGYNADRQLELLENEVQPHSKLQETIGNKYFLKTRSETPFCLQLYRVSVELAKPFSAENWVHGQLKAYIYSPNGFIKVDVIPEGTEIYHAKTYSVIVADLVNLDGNIRQIKLRWAYEINILKPKTVCMFWCNDHLYVKRVMVDELKQPRSGYGKPHSEFSHRLCPKYKKDHEDIANGQTAIFSDSCGNTSNKN